MILRWNSLEATRYSILHSSDLINGAFDVLESGIPATVPENVHELYELPDGPHYFMIREDVTP